MSHISIEALCLGVPSAWCIRPALLIGVSTGVKAVAQDTVEKLAKEKIDDCMLGLLGSPMIRGSHSGYPLVMTHIAIEHSFF